MLWRFQPVKAIVVCTVKSMALDMLEIRDLVKRPLQLLQ